MKAILFMILIPVYCYCNSAPSVSRILVDQSTVELVLKSEPGKTYRLSTSPDLDTWEESDEFVADQTAETITLAKTDEPAEFYAFSESATSPLIQGPLTELLTLNAADFADGGPYSIGATSHVQTNLLGFNPADESVYLMVIGYDFSVSPSEHIAYFKVGADGVPILVNQENGVGSTIPTSPSDPLKKTLFIGDKLYSINGYYDLTVLDFSTETPNQATVGETLLFNGKEYEFTYSSHILTNGEKLVVTVESTTQSLDPARSYYAVFDSDLSLLNVCSYPYFDGFGQKFTPAGFGDNGSDRAVIVGDYLYALGNLSYNFSEPTNSESGCAIRKLNLNDGTYEDFIILDNPNDSEFGTHIFKFNNDLLVYGRQDTYSSTKDDHTFFMKIDLNCVPIWTKYKSYERVFYPDYRIVVSQPNYLTLAPTYSQPYNSHFLHVGESGDISVQGTGFPHPTAFFSSDGGNIFGSDGDYSALTIFMIDVEP